MQLQCHILQKGMGDGVRDFSIDITRCVCLPGTSQTIQSDPRHAMQPASSATCLLVLCTVWHGTTPAFSIHQ